MGGITDWFKGMVTLYDFCIKNCLAFKIHSKEKFNFEDFFIPNEYDWRLTDEEYTLLEQHKSSLHLCLSESGIENSDGWYEQQSVLKLICGTKRVKALIIHGVAPYGLPAFGQRFNSLFQMSELLEDSVNSIKRKINGTYISVSFRFVNLLQDSSEVVAGMDDISHDNQIALVGRCIKKLEQLMNVYDGANVLVTTDSYNFLLALDKNESLKGRTFYLKGEKIHQHIGFSQEISYKGLLKSYTEFMLISQAERAFLVQVGPMYESKFPKWASTINGIPYTIVREN